IPHLKNPRKSPESPSPAWEKSRAGSFARTLCLCLVCAVLGGLGGGSYAASRLTERVDALQQGMTELKEQATLAKENGTLASATAAGDAGTIPASTIYDRACRQVVGITTEVAYTNFFGMTSSSAVTGTGFIVSENGYIVTNYHVNEMPTPEARI
ncbi:MAG: hypothetical protein V8T45_08380, partial [Oscillospiraceae bacterium]